MATVTHGITTAATTNTSPQSSGAFTPAAGDLLIAFVVTSDSVAASPPTTLTTTTAGVYMGWARVISATYRTSLDTVYCFVGNQPAVAVSQTVTINMPTDAPTGTIIVVERVAGMTRYGMEAIRQSAKTDNAAAAGTPAATFGGVALTGNVVLTAGGNSTNPWVTAVPASFTSRAATGYATPTTGGAVATRDSGHTVAAVTWGGTSASAFGVVAVELDTQSPVTWANPEFNTPLQQPSDTYTREYK